MTIVAVPVHSITRRKLARGLSDIEALRGLFGFGIVTIALTQAVAFLFSVHLTTVWQVVLGVVGGALGACIGAISSADSDNRE